MNASPALAALRRRWTSILLCCLAVLTVAAAAPAQVARPGELPSMDAAVRSAVIDSIIAVIDSVYVLEEPAERIVAELGRNRDGGAYDGLSDPAELAARIMADAQAVNHDGHFGIAAFPPLPPAVVQAREEEDPDDVARRRRRARAQNYGFRKAEILPGGIGYLEFDRFADGDDAFAAAAAAMNFLANSDAVILDLRRNGGGSASMIRFLCGYLFAEKEHLINWDIRAEGTTVQSYSADYVPGRRLTGQPVYVLVSGNTFSAAEEFTFDLRHLERATIVGETTGGGGHTVASYTFDFDGFRIGIRVPYGRAYDPATNEGWEGVGVQPHIAVPAAQALAAARADILKKLLAEEEDEDLRADLQWALTDLEGDLNPLELTPAQLSAYAGRYGPRRITLEDGVLYYQREDRPRMELVPLGADLFRVGDLDFFRASFARNGRGEIVKFVGLYQGGRTDENERDGD